MTCHQGCCPTYRDHLLSISIAASACPSRSGGRYAAHINATEKRWEKDFAAVKQLKKDGIVPKSTDGVADLVARARTRTEIETGKVLSNKQRIQLEHLTEKDVT